MYRIVSIIPPQFLLPLRPMQKEIGKKKRIHLGLNLGKTHPFLGSQFAKCKMRNLNKECNTQCDSSILGLAN